MSTEQEDAAMLLELQEKITHRIREQILVCAMGFEPGMPDPEGTRYSAGQINDAFVSSIASKLVSHPTFVSNMTKAIASKITSAIIY